MVSALVGLVLALAVGFALWWALALPWPVIWCVQAVLGVAVGAVLPKRIR